MNMYYLIITYPEQSRQVLMNTGLKAVAALDGNEDLLIDMGKRLVRENVIQSYQLVQTVAPEENRATLWPERVE